MRNKPIVQFFFPVLLAALFSQCSTKNQGGSERPAEEVQVAAAVRDSVLKSFRSAVSGQVPHLAASVQPELLSDITRSYHYLQLSNKGGAAANLGVYMSDLAYLVQFRQTADVQRYFDACYLLADYVGMKEQFRNVVELRFGDIISGNQEVEKSIALLFKDATNSSRGEEFKKMHAAALTGYYVEELYRLARFAQVQTAHGPLGELENQQVLEALQLLIGQKEEVNHLIGYFDHIQLKSEGIAAYQEFLKLQAAYQALNTPRMAKEKDPSVIMQDSQVQSIIDLVVSLRKRITEV